jgi:hypothetical protein
MKNNILSALEYAIKDKKKDINKILKKNPEEIKKIQINTFIYIIHLNEFDLLDNILKSINNKLKIYILSNNEIVKQLLNSNNLEFINKYKKYIYLNKLYDTKYIIDLCINTNNFEFVQIIYDIYKTLPDSSLLGHIFSECFNNNIKINLELIKFLIKIDRNMVNEKYNKIPVLAYAILNNNLELLEILKQAGINFYYDDFNILNYYINKKIKINNNIILFLLNNNININICNTELWLPVHRVFFNPKNYTLEVKKKILKETKNLNIQNTLGNTVLHYIILNDNIKKYNDILVNKKLDIFIKNKALDTPLSIAISKKINKKLMDIVVESFINQMKKSQVKYTKEEAIKFILANKISIYKKTNDNDNIIIADYNYVNHNKFSTNSINTQLFFIVMLQRYNNLGIPYLSNNKIKLENKTYPNEVFNNFIQRVKKYLYYKKEFMYLKIYWGDENNYLITPNIGEAIKNTFKFKKYVIVFLHIYNKSMSHANVLIFDKEKKIIVHFEPHGKLNGYIGKLYETMKNIFKKELKGFKYIAPLEYLPNNAYQVMDNQNLYNKKVGDRLGYCGAWCFWFVELYINNNKYDLKSLVDKSIKKLINTKYTFIDHIRNYANNLNEKNVELLNNYGIKYNYINNQSFTDDTEDLILNEISYNLKKLIL